MLWPWSCRRPHVRSGSTCPCVCVPVRVSDTTRFPKDNSLPLLVTCFLFSLMATSLLCVTRVKWRSLSRTPAVKKTQHTHPWVCGVQHRECKMKEARRGTLMPVKTLWCTIKSRLLESSKLSFEAAGCREQHHWLNALSPTLRLTFPKCPSWARLYLSLQLGSSPHPLSYWK